MLPGYGAIVGARPGGGTTLAPGGAGAGRGDENAKLGGENCEVSLMHLGCVIAFLKDEDPDNERGGVFRPYCPSIGYLSHVASGTDIRWPELRPGKALVGGSVLPLAG